MERDAKDELVPGRTIRFIGGPFDGQTRERPEQWWVGVTYQEEDAGQAVYVSWRTNRETGEREFIWEHDPRYVRAQFL